MRATARLLQLDLRHPVSHQLGGAHLFILWWWGGGGGAPGRSSAAKRYSLPPPLPSYLPSAFGYVYFHLPSSLSHLQNGASLQRLALARSSFSSLLHTLPPSLPPSLYVRATSDLPGQTWVRNQSSLARLAVSSFEFPNFREAVPHTHSDGVCCHYNLGVGTARN